MTFRHPLISQEIFTQSFRDKTQENGVLMDMVKLRICKIKKTDFEVDTSKRTLWVFLERVVKGQKKKAEEKNRSTDFWKYYQGPTPAFHHALWLWLWTQWVTQRRIIYLHSAWNLIFLKIIFTIKTLWFLIEWRMCRKPEKNWNLCSLFHWEWAAT